MFTRGSDILLCENFFVQIQKQREMQREEANKRALANLRLERKSLEDAAHRNELLSKQLEKLGQANAFKTHSEVEQTMVTKSFCDMQNGGISQRLRRNKLPLFLISSGRAGIHV
jgi:hypothetical protein